MDRPEFVEEFGREVVKRLHDELLAQSLQDWAKRPVGGKNTPYQLLEATGLTDEQRWLVWQIINYTVELSYHRLVHFLDDWVSSGQLDIQIKDPDDENDPPRSISWTDSIDMPYGFSAEMLERYGVDPAAVWEQAKSWTLPPGRREDGVVLNDPRPPEMDRPRPTPEQMAAYAKRLRDGGRDCPECNRPPAALRQVCKRCGQAY